MAADTSLPEGAVGRPPAALSIGKFDGVHAGHRRIVARLLDEARRRGARSVAWILHPDPASVLFGRSVPALTTPPERIERLGALGVDHAAVVPFTPALSRLSPAGFLDRVGNDYTLRSLVVGPDFALGRDRAGDVATLSAMGRERGFEVVVVEPLIAGGRRVGSRRIAELVAAGDIATARALLCAPPRVSGTVIHGAARGRRLGFPTANLDVGPDRVVPGDGIYTVRATWTGARAPGGGVWLDGVASIGVRPTFDGGPRSVEVHLLDFAGDLYGRELVVEILARQRGEERFESVAALVAQMHADVAVARANHAAEARAGNTV